MADTMVLLGTATVSGTSTYSVTFNNISQGYTDLKIVMSQKTNRNDVYQGQVIYFNGSASGSTQVLQANGSATVTANTTAATVIQNAEGNDSTTTNIYGMIELYVGGYSQQGTFKSAYAQSVAEANATTVYNTINYLDSNSTTDPITSIKIESGNLSYALLAGSQYYLYGIFNQDVSTVPSAPTIGTATVGNLSASVTFTGVSGAASYTVTSSPGGLTGTGVTSPIRVGGLTAGTAYTFTVKANNPFGSSASSAASNSVTPTTPGTTWTVRTGALGTSSGWEDIAYFGGAFLTAPSDVIGKVSYSPNGVTWTSISTATTGSPYWTGVAFGAGVWSISNRSQAGTGFQHMWSTDGFNWTYGSGGSNALLPKLAWNGVAFFVGGQGFNYGDRSTDGKTWSQITLPSAQGWGMIAGRSGYFILGQDGGASPVNVVATSSDNGSTWTQRTITGTAQRWQAAAYDTAGTKCVAVARTNNAGAYTTDDGVTWTASTLTSGTWVDITYGDGYWIAIGWSNCATSPDGITWTARTIPTGTSGGGEGIVYGAQGAVVVQYGTSNTATAF